MDLPSGKSNLKAMDPNPSCLVIYCGSKYLADSLSWRAARMIATWDKPGCRPQTVALFCLCQKKPRSFLECWKYVAIIGIWSDPVIIPCSGFHPLKSKTHRTLKLVDVIHKLLQKGWILWKNVSWYRSKILPMITMAFINSFHFKQPCP